jgi:hypothetical protein
MAAAKSARFRLRVDRVHYGNYRQRKRDTALTEAHFSQQVQISRGAAFAEGDHAGIEWREALAQIAQCRHPLIDCPALLAFADHRSLAVVHHGVFDRRRQRKEFVERFADLGRITKIKGQLKLRLAANQTGGLEHECVALIAEVSLTDKQRQ